MDIVTAFLFGRIIVPYDNVVTSVAILEMFEDLKLCPSIFIYRLWFSCLQLFKFSYHCYIHVFVEPMYV